MNKINNYDDELFSLPFDQYQRYRVVSDIINKIRMEGDTFKILDIGAGSEQNLKRFLPNDNIYFLDKDEPTRRNADNYIVGNIIDFDLNKHFDIVVTIDTYEHIGPEFRDNFIKKIIETSDIATIIAAPFNTPGVNECEIFMNEYYKFHNNQEHRWLQEHIQNGLPSLESTKKLINKLGFNYLVVPNGYLPRWFEMISLHLLTVGKPEFSKVITELCRYYNINFYEYDNKDPAYRNVIIVNKNSKKLDLMDIYAKDNTSDSFILNCELLKSTIEKIKTSFEFKYNKLDDQILQKCLSAFSAQTSELREQAKSLNLAVSERDGRIAGLVAELEKASERATSFEMAVLERDRKNQAVIEELKQSRNSALKLDQKVLEQDKRISILNEEIQKTNERALSLELMMSEKDGRIATLIEQLNQSENHALWLENEISDMRRSVVWTLTMKYHNTFVERLLPPNTRKRNCYDRGIKGLRIIVNEGWGLFWCKFNEYRASRKYTEDIDTSIEERILNNSKNILSENNQISLEATKNGSDISSISQYFLKDYIRCRLLSFLSETTNELLFTKYEYPVVSIILLTYNKVEYTFQCLESILSNTDIEYEVIIVDNGSTDETTSLLNKILNINVIRNDDNLGFILGCNMGASVSNGKYILFLNNDIVVTPRWLSKLVNTIESNSRIGAVGCKLVWPNGLLQEAGSIIWNDGSALGYGRGDNPLSPEYSYIRRVDYCSGACLLVRRDVFEGLGGFDERYIPAYYEDSDLCIAIQESGYDVVYQPNVTVFHHEFTSSSPENAKKLMESNRLKFVEKWGNVLEKKYFPSLDNVISARDVSQRPKILVLDDRIPAPYQGSGFPRAYEMLRIISELGFKTTFYPLDKTIPWQPATNELQQAGIEVIYGERLAFTEFAKERSNFYDIVLVSRPHNMEKTLPIIKEYFPRAKLVYDAEAIFSTREILKASVRGSSLDKTQIENMVSKEMNLMENADLVITVSEREKKTIEERGYLKPVGVWGHSIIPKNTESGFHERRDLLFVGGFLASDSPNEDAILYFVKEIFPTIKKEISCRLFIVGINPPESVKKLASSSIIVTGYVDDITEYYEKCRVFVVPHRFSAGIPYKLDEAMSYGIPAVVSELTAYQLSFENGHEVLVAKDADEFAKKIIELYKNEDLWNLIRSNSLKSIQLRCNPKLMEQKFKQLLDLIV